MDGRRDRTETGQGEWKPRVRTALEACFPDIAQAVGGQRSSGILRFRPIKIRKRSITVAVQVGDGTGVLKLFDGGDDDAGQAYVHEKAALAVFGPPGLAPRLLAHSDQRRFVVTRHAGIRLDDGPAREWGASEAARRIGQWTARCEAIAPSRPATGNWFGYLKKFGDQLKIDQVDGAFDRLSDIPLCGVALARNDVALHNFLVSPDQQIMACDFEQCCVRPRGWDYVTTFHALLQRYPDDSETVLDAYADGFSSAHKGALIVDELNQVARFLFVAQADVAATREDVSWP